MTHSNESRAPSNEAARPPDARSPWPRALFVAAFVLVAFLAKTFLTGEDRPVSDRILGSWTQGSETGQTRRSFDSDGAARLERSTRSGPFGNLSVTERHSGRFTFTDATHMTVEFDGGIREDWTVSFPSESLLHLGGTGLQGGTFLNAGEAPSYAPTSPR